MSGECLIDGIVDVRDVPKILKEHNELIEQQNTILQGILDELRFIGRQRL